jgi:hypothetical protein
MIAKTKVYHALALLPVFRLTKQQHDVKTGISAVKLLNSTKNLWNDEKSTKGSHPYAVI